MPSPCVTCGRDLDSACLSAQRFDLCKFCATVVYGEEFKAMRRLWDAVTKPPGGPVGVAPEPAKYLKTLAAQFRKEWTFTYTAGWLDQIADALEPPKPAPPEASRKADTAQWLQQPIVDAAGQAWVVSATRQGNPPAPPAETCAECGKPVDPSCCTYLAFQGRVHNACCDAWKFRKRGERVCASLKVGDAVRMADKPRVGPERNYEWDPVLVAGQVGEVCPQAIPCGNEKDRVPVLFSKRGRIYSYRAGNLTRLVPDPEFKE